MSGRPGTARPSRLEVRATARTNIALFLRGLFTRTRAALADVSEVLGQARDNPHVDRCLNPSDETQWQTADSLLLDQDERDEIAEFIAGPTRLVIERPDAEQLEDDLDRALAALEHATDALRALKHGGRDGALDRAEGRAVREPAMRGARLLLAIAELGATAEREGVIGLRRPSLVPSLPETDR